MDRFLHDLIVKRWKIGSFSFTFLDILLAVCITGTGVMLRMAVVEYTVTTPAKLAAMILDFVLAAFCAVLVYRYTGHRNRSFLTYAVLAIYPTMVANSALWGKNSVFYAFLFFLGLYLYTRNWKILSILSVAVGAGIALSGMTLSTRSLTLGWPNFYEIIGKNMFVELYNQVSLLILLGLLLTLVYCFLKKQVVMTNDMALRLLLFLAVLVPYFAPSMPAWAGYTADIAALLYAMRWPKKFYLPMIQLIVSYSAYANVINGESKLPMVLYSVMLLAVLVDVGVDLYRDMTR
jgi:hypothetical protein